MIYLDNAATTKTYESSAKIMSDMNLRCYFNPSALYAEASECAKKVKQARDNIKKALYAPPGELYFTSGGSESDNTALLCARKKRGGTVIVSEGEHDAVINPAQRLKEEGYNVVFAPILSDGSIDHEAFASLLDESVSLVSVMHVSNETGAINDIKKLVKLTRKYAPNALFHSDGVQAFCKIKVNLSALDVDLYTISGHKIHAPKGIGGLFVKKGVPIKPLIYGGGQEKGFRSGTENTGAILAFEDAVSSNIRNFEADYSKKYEIIEHLKRKLLSETDDTIIITPNDNRAPHILTVAFKDVRGEVLLHALEKHGILIGIGSACSSRHESRFKDLLALDSAHRDGIARFSVSQFNETEEIDSTIRAIKAELPGLTEFKRI